MTSPPSSSQSSFWAEAANLPLVVQPLPPAPSPSKKRVRYQVSPDSSEVDPHDILDNPRPQTTRKRVRYVVSPDSSEVDPYDIVVDPLAHPLSPPAAADTFTSASLKYLPPRTGGLSGPHAYLDNPEYAANAFGDIASYMRNKDIKVQAQNAAIAAAKDSELPQIFAGLTFYINGNVKPSMEVLRKLILQRGGTVVPYVRQKTGLDFVVAPVLTLAKFREFGKTKIVREAWIVQCAEQGRKLDWRPFKLNVEGGWEAEGSKGLQSFVRGIGDRPNATTFRNVVRWHDAAAQQGRPRAIAGAKHKLSDVGDPAGAEPKGEPSTPNRALCSKAPSTSLLPESAEQLLQISRLSPAPELFADLDTDCPTHPVELVPELNPKPNAKGPATAAEGHDPALPKLPAPPQPLDFPVATKSILRQQRTTRASTPTTPGLVSDHASSSTTTLAPTTPPRLRLPEVASALHAKVGLELGADEPLETTVEEGTVSPTAATKAVAAAKAKTGGSNVPHPPPSKTESAWTNYARHKSNPHAAKLMQSAEFRTHNTAVLGNDAGYIDKYYQNSRLSHLSRWKTELRVLVAEARARANGAETASVPIMVAPPGTEKVYMHVDFDAFFVSAGLSTRPHLRGVPVVVCHSARGGNDSTSEIASACYEARAKGVKNGMSLGRARQLAGPQLQTIPYEFDTYKRFSLLAYTVLLGYADELEAVSVDEAFLDVTGAVTAGALAPDSTSADPAIQVADRIRCDIRKETGCEVSIGIGPNVLLARLATRKAKPAGVFLLAASAAPEFLGTLDVDQLPGVGWATKDKIKESFGTVRCAELLAVSVGALRRALGPKTGATLYGYLRGHDERALEPDKDRKSVSVDMNYGIRFETQAQADKCVADLGAEVAKRLHAISARGRHMTLKIMVRAADAPREPPKFMGHGRCDTFNKAGPLAGPRGTATNDPEAIGIAAVGLLESMKLDPAELRGIGITITKLDNGVFVAKGQSRLTFGKEAGPEDSEATLAAQAQTTVAGVVPEKLHPGLQHPQSRFNTMEHPQHTAAGSSRLVSGAQSPTALSNPSAVIEPPGGRSALSPSRLPSESQVLVGRYLPAVPETPAALSGTARVPLHLPSLSPVVSRTPASDHIDPEWLAALPDDIRQEWEAEHAAIRQARTAPTPAPVRPTEQPAVSPASKTPGAKSKSTLHPAAHISRQLRPKHKAHMDNQVIRELPLVHAFRRAEDRGFARALDQPLMGPSRSNMSSRHPSVQPESIVGGRDGADDGGGVGPAYIGKFAVAELQRLNLDLDVFGALPQDVQREAVAQARTRVALFRPAAWQEHGPVSPRSGRVRDSGPPLVAARASLPLFSKKLPISSTYDLCRNLDAWVEQVATKPSGGGGGAAVAAGIAANARNVARYLVRCLHSGMGGVDHVAQLLRHLRTLIRDLERDLARRHAAPEAEEAQARGTGAEDGEAEILAAWWAAWAMMKDEVDKGTAALLGGPLRL